jgi:hypothetical protein
MRRGRRALCRFLVTRDAAGDHTRGGGGGAGPVRARLTGCTADLAAVALYGPLAPYRRTRRVGATWGLRFRPVVMVP